MKASLVMALVGAAALPVAIQTGVGPIDPSAAGEGDLFDKAAKLAEERFSGAADLSVLEVSVTDHRIGVFGERIRPDPGYAFHVAKVRIENTGKIDVSVASHQFSGIDDAKSDHWIEMGGAHDDFEGARLSTGHARNGLVTFELIMGAYLTSVTWEGDLANATAEVGSYAHP